MDNQKMNNNRPDQDPEGGNNKKDDMNKKSLLVMVVLAIAVMIIAQMLSGKIASASQKEVTYTEFMQDVKDGKVTSSSVLIMVSKSPFSSSVIMPSSVMSKSRSFAFDIFLNEERAFTLILSRSSDSTSGKSFPSGHIYLQK